VGFPQGFRSFNCVLMRFEICGAMIEICKYRLRASNQQCWGGQARGQPAAGRRPPGRVQRRGGDRGAVRDKEANAGMGFFA